MTDEEYMSVALEQAHEAKSNHEWPFGAVIVQNGKVIAKNRCREGATKNVLMHAELQAVQDACLALGTNKLRNCVIYCTNEPCPMCAAAIFQAKISKVVIGASRQDLGNLLRSRSIGIDDLAADSGYPIEIIRDVRKDDILTIFSDIKK